MLKTAILLAAFVATSTACFAATPADKHDPIPGKEDRRIRTFPYDPANMMRLTSPGLTPVRVVFAEGTTITTVAGSLVIPEASKATDWFSNNEGNSLIFQPLHADIPPSIVFVTARNKDGAQENYVIELHVGTGDLITDAGDAYAQVTFTYPAQQAAAAAEARARAFRIQTESKVRTSLTQARFSAPRQWHYSKMGQNCDVLTPSGWNWISDDGHQVAMLFPPHMQEAEFYSRQNDQDKNESLVTPVATTTAVGTLDVLPDVFRQIVLRRGKLVCALRADRYDPDGTQPGGGSGTISADVIRVRHAR